jgi:hypothetical protein
MATEKLGDLDAHVLRHLSHVLRHLSRSSFASSSATCLHLNPPFLRHFPHLQSRISQPVAVEYLSLVVEYVDARGTRRVPASVDARGSRRVPASVASPPSSDT